MVHGKLARGWLTTTPIITSQCLCFKNICMVDGSWPCTSIFSGCRWVWKDTSGQTQLMGIRNQRRREFSLHLELEALYWAMDNMLHHSKC